MLLTEEGYKENKLARLFKASHLKESVQEERGGYITSSLYTAHLGAVEGFSNKSRPHLDPYQSLGANLVFLSDGALWVNAKPLSTSYSDPGFLPPDELPSKGRSSRFWH